MTPNKIKTTAVNKSGYVIYLKKANDFYETMQKANDSLLRKFNDWPEVYRAGADPGYLSNDEFVITDGLPITVLNRDPMPYRRYRSNDPLDWTEVWLITKLVICGRPHVIRLKGDDTIGKMLDRALFWNVTGEIKDEIRAIMIVEKHCPNGNNAEALVTQVTVYRYRLKVMKVLEEWHRMHRTE